MSHIAQTARLLWQPAGKFYADGIDYIDYLLELAWLWLYSTTEDWQAWQQLSAWQQFTDYDELLAKLGKNPATTCLSHPQQLQILARNLQHVIAYPVATQAEIYEYILLNYPYKTYTYAPAALVDAIILVMQPQFNEQIQDIAAGTGQFIIAAEQYINITQEQQASYLYAQEQNPKLQQLAMINYILHNSNCIDNREAGPGISTMADIIITNLLFSSEPLSHLKHIFHSLAPNGRAAVILPAGILYQSDGESLRQQLMQFCDLHTILSLPVGMFYPSTHAAQVLFFQRHELKNHQINEQIWHCDLRHDLPNLGLHRKLKRHHLMEFIDYYAAKHKPSSVWQLIKHEELQHISLELNPALIWEDTINELQQIKLLLQ
jgi:type I restriction enzyme M protein